jgi:hypothetical protein
MITLQDKAIKLFESQLKAFKDSALPFATRQTVNSAAFETMKRAKIRVREDFILKNKFTEKSIRVNPTRSLDVDTQEASVGSTADYMAVQEHGGIKSKKGKHGVTLPTSVAAGQAQGSKPRTKTPKPRFKMSAIKLKYKRYRYSSKKQANAVAIKQAIKYQDKFVYLETGNKKGIYEIKGNRTTLKITKLKMLYDLSHPGVVLKPHRWLEPSVAEVEKRMSSLYFKALKQQLIRHNLFKNI